MQVSGYPSNTQAANVSKETTSKEIIEVGNVDKDVFKEENINLLFGPVNSGEYCTNMLNFPKLVEIPLLANKAA